MDKKLHQILFSVIHLPKFWSVAAPLLGQLFRRRHFQMHKKKQLHFDSHFIEVCSRGSNQLQMSNGRGNGLA